MSKNPRAERPGKFFDQPNGKLIDLILNKVYSCIQFKYQIRISASLRHG